MKFYLHKNVATILIKHSYSRVRNIFFEALNKIFWGKSPFCSKTKMEACGQLLLDTKKNFTKRKFKQNLFDSWHLKFLEVSSALRNWVQFGSNLHDKYSIVFLMKNLQWKTWSVNFEEIINFAEFWALSWLKWNDLKTGEGLAILKRYFKNINETLDSECIMCGSFYAYLICECRVSDWMDYFQQRK